MIRADSTFDSRLMLAAALATCALACGDSSGPPNQDEVGSVSLTLPASTILIGDTVPVTVVVRDPAGNEIDVQVTLQSGTPTVAAVLGDPERVIGISAGGPVTITASAGGKSATKTLDVADDQRFAYAVANLPQAPVPYAPDPGYSYSSGGPIEVSRSAVGIYSVRFVGLGRHAAQHDNVQVTAFGGAPGDYCKSAGWQLVGTDLVADVRCFSPSGLLHDNRFTILATGARALQGRVAFVLTQDPAASAPPDPGTSYSSATVRPVEISRLSPGVYDVGLHVGRTATSTAETVQVMAVGPGAERCHVAGWDKVTGVAQVTCNASNGTPTDTRFSVLWVERGRPGQRAGFAWANDPLSLVVYTPNPDFSYNSSGGAVSAIRDDVGLYRVLFPGLAKHGAATETVLVTEYAGLVEHHCRVDSWANTPTDWLEISVSCYNSSGVLANARFNLLVVQ